MGIKHLTKIEKYMKKNWANSYTKSQLREFTGINYKTIGEALDYLMSEKRVEKLTNYPDKLTRYRWCGVKGTFKVGT